MNAANNNTKKKREKMKTTTNAFVVFDRATNKKLATLPLTAPIQATIDAYTRAGLAVGWKWGKLTKSKSTN
jgi:hypothetical protein